MRVFDIAGGLAVTFWLSVVGYFVYDHYFRAESQGLEAGAVFREGESYMLLTRKDQEVGFIHEARTRVDETNSWLLEYDLMMNVSMLGIDQFLETKIKATVDQSAYLQDFSAAITTAGTTFDLTGEVEGSVVTMSMDLAGETRTQKIQLREPPRLSNSALNELVANPDLEPGMKFEQEYFDPTTMGMTKMTFEYVRQHDVDVFGEIVPTYHFRQLVAGNELDAYVDKFGEVQLQEFPLQIAGARLPEALGRARAEALRRKFEKEQANKKSTDAPNLSLEATVGLLRNGNLSSALSTSHYRISNIPDGVVLDLDSGEQHVTVKKESEAEVDTAEQGVEGGLTDVDVEPLLASTLRVDAEDPSFDGLLGDGAPESNTLKAEMIARAVRKRMKEQPEVGVQTASAALKAGTGDCTEFALVLVAALRHFGVPARFVSGVKLNPEGQFVAHQWVQYFDGGRFIDVDATTDTLLPGTDQIQLFTHAAPERPELATVIDQIQIEKIIDEDTKPEASPQGAESDFN